MVGGGAGFRIRGQGFRRGTGTMIFDNLRRYSKNFDELGHKNKKNIILAAEPPRHGGRQSLGNQSPSGFVRLCQTLEFLKSAGRTCHRGKLELATTINSHDIPSNPKVFEPKKLCGRMAIRPAPSGTTGNHRRSGTGKQVPCRNLINQAKPDLKWPCFVFQKRCSECASTTSPRPSPSRSGGTEREPETSGLRKVSTGQQAGCPAGRAGAPTVWTKKRSQNEAIWE